MPRLTLKAFGVILLCALGVSLSYMVVGLYKQEDPTYPYMLYPDKPLKPRTASAPRIPIRILPIGPATLTARAEDAPATPVNPTAPSTPTPAAPTPAVDPPSVAATPSPNAHQGSGLPAPLVMLLGHPEFHVQAGAFKQREYADILIRQLRANGYTVTLAEGPLLRVWVGPAMSHPAAVRLAANLRSQGFEAFLTPVR